VGAAPLFWISEAARLPQPKSVFPSPTVGLATEEYTHVHVYGLRKSIKADELFDGRLEAFGVREEVRPEGGLIDSRRT
jgi:hypothetical protein